MGNSSATYTKLRNGQWGIRVPGTVGAGQTITVTKRDGSTSTETVDRVLWSGDGVSLCSVSRGHQSTSHRHGHSSRRSGGRYECDECGDIVTPGTHCWETGMVH